MPPKQSNKQSVNLKVTVNNNISSKSSNVNKDKKSKPRKQQPPPPPPDEMDDFPVLNTPARNPTAMPNISALPVRNTVYMPSTVQISPEGAQPPIPAYFERPYTNLVRTIEDMRNSLMSEIEDVKGLMNTNPEMMAQETQTQPQGVTVGTDTMPRQMTMAEPQSIFDINPDPFGSPTETPKQQEQNSALSTPSPSVTYEYAPSPFMNQFLLNRELFQDVPLSTMETQTPPTMPRMTQVAETEISKDERRLLRLPVYVRQFNEASEWIKSKKGLSPRNDTEKEEFARYKTRKNKMFEKIKNIGAIIGIPQIRGRSAKDYINLVVAEVERNRL